MVCHEQCPGLLSNSAETCYLKPQANQTSEKQPTTNTVDTSCHVKKSVQL